jgi:hypothetical protein
MVVDSVHEMERIGLDALSKFRYLRCSGATLPHLLLLLKEGRPYVETPIEGGVMAHYPDEQEKRPYIVVDLSSMCSVSQNGNVPPPLYQYAQHVIFVDATIESLAHIKFGAQQSAIEIRQHSEIQEGAVEGFPLFCTIGWALCQLDSPNCSPQFEPEIAPILPPAPTIL